jgi:branched-chain amino acid transport system permease protein
MHFVLDLAFQGLINGAIYALISVGLAMVYGLLRILHIAHAGLFTLGGYLGLVITNATGSLALAMVATVLLVGLCGVLLYRLCYAPILQRPPFVVLIVSIGLFIAMQEVYRIVFGPYALTYNAIPLQTKLSLGGFTASAAELLVILFVILAFGALGLFTRFTRFGIACRATVSDPTMAASFGVPLERVREAAFFIGSAFAAIAGIMVGILDNLVEPTMGDVPSYKSLAIIVLGGFGDIRGTLLAALFIGIVEAFGTVYLSGILDRDAIAFAALLAVLMVRPRGLLAR